VKEHVVPEGAVPLRVAVTTTHVPAGPMFGRRFRLERCRSLLVARTLVGTVTEYMEMNRADVNNNSRKVEPTLRVGNLTHALLIS
jgi:hypothetical protein